MLSEAVFCNCPASYISEMCRQNVHRILSVVVFCYFMLLAEGAGAERRQTNLPISCSTLVLEVNVTTTTCPGLSAFRSTVDQITNPFHPEWNTGPTRDWLEDTLDDFCTSDCLDYTVQYYSQNCGWSEEYADNWISLYQNYFCASNKTNGQYCLVEVMDYYDDTTAFLDVALQCDSTYDDEFCSPLCMKVLEDLKNELGCCAVNLFSSTSSNQSLYELLFERCGLSLNPADICTDGAMRTSIASLLMLFVAVSLSTFCIS